MAASGAADSMVELKAIVDQLNSPPFRMNLTLVGFSHKQPIELLQIVNDVFTELDPSHKRDLRDEQSDATALRMLDFLNVCKYQIDDLAEFKEQFMRGNPTVLYPLLYWMLPKLPDLRKRTYLARYLRPVDIPEEFFADQQLLEQLKKYKELQELFKETHKAVDKARVSSVNPQELGAEIDQLEQERTQLQNKLAKLRERVSGPEYQAAKFDDILKITHLLRKEQEEEQTLAKSTREQKQRLQNQLALLQQRQQNLHELKLADERRQNPQEMLAKLRDDVKAARFLCNEKLEKDIKEHENQLREAGKLLVANPLAEDQVDELDRDVRDLTAQAAELQHKKEQMHAATDDKLQVFRAQVAGVEKKKEKMLEQVRDMEQDKREADAELQKVSAELEALSAGGLKPKSDAEKKAFMAQLDDKLKRFEKYKAELADLHRENDILIRTEEILRARDANIAEFNAELEKRAGVAGFSDAQDALESVSQGTGAVDKLKSDTLDDISKTVETIKTLILNKHNKLKPMIVEFKAQRAKADDIEAEYQKKKRAYEATVLALNSERMTLEKEVEQNTAQLKEEETSYHYLNGLAVVAQARQQMLKEENTFLSGKRAYSAEHKTYQDALQTAIREHEALAKRLHREQKDVKETHDSTVERRKAHVHLKALLQLKLRVVVAERRANGAGGAMGGGAAAAAGAGMGLGGGANGDGANFMALGMDADSLGGGGGDRMVVNE